MFCYLALFFALDYIACMLLLIIINHYWKCAGHVFMLLTSVMFFFTHVFIFPSCLGQVTRTALLWILAS